MFKNKKTSISKPKKILSILRPSIIARAFVLSAVVDLAVAEGKYGGQVLDSMDFNKTANSYRFVGVGVSGITNWAVLSVKSYGDDLAPLIDKYGQPKP